MSRCVAVTESFSEGTIGAQVVVGAGKTVYTRGSVRDMLLAGVTEEVRDRDRSLWLGYE
jgi:tRNA A37 threonylcarbamoyladenosine biosynthesis protein TsaE